MNFRASDSPIVHGFQAFYYELLRQKEKALSAYFSVKPSFDPKVDEESEVIANTDGNIVYSVENKSNEVEGMIVSIQRKLISSIENVFDMISSKSKLGQKRIEEAKYIMTILADEIFINMRWEGSKFWRFSLLEKQLFQTEVSGERFFQLLDFSISDANSAKDEIIFLYLMALSLGFKGKYRDAEKGEDYLIWYKDKLYALLHKKPSRLFYPGRACLIENCYVHTISEENKSFIPDTRFWTWVITGIIILYMIISYSVWFGITDDVLDVIKSINEQIRKGPLI